MMLRKMLKKVVKDVPVDDKVVKENPNVTANPKKVGIHDRLKYLS